MNYSILFSHNEATSEVILIHLHECDPIFLRNLYKQNDINKYINKLVNHSERIEAWIENKLIGLVAIYCNDHVNNRAYITNVSVLEEWQGKSIAQQLLSKSVKYAKDLGMVSICLEVANDNIPAIKLYQKNDFLIICKKACTISMSLDLSKGDSDAS